jgi:hypothetical protein
VKGYYESLLAVDGGSGDSKDSDPPTMESGDEKPKASQTPSSEKWRGQIEKVDSEKKNHYFVSIFSYIHKFCISKNIVLNRHLLRWPF